jgi:formylglycine-generating enzyme required for sulfatase activity
MPETKTRPLRVFLCHASQDKPIVQDLYNRLNAVSWIDPWLDEEKLFPGQDWNLEIEKAVEAADAILVCLSNDSVTKEGYVQRELRYVLDIAEYKPEGTLYIIPVRLEECNPPRRLRIWQYSDYFPKEERDSSFERLLVSLRMRANRLGILEASLEEKQAQTKAEDNGKIVESRVRETERELTQKHIDRTSDKEQEKSRGKREEKPDQPEKKPTRSINLLPISIGGIVFLALACLIFGGTYIYQNLLLSVEPSPTKVLPVVVPTYLSASTHTPSTVEVELEENGIGNTMVSESDGMTMLYIPAGEFTMGSEDGEINETPVHTVYLGSFWIDQTEVTNLLFAKCVQAGMCNTPASKKSNLKSNYFDNPEFENYPVVMVSWNDANSYCEWAGRRLPTEAEWEKAARGGLAEKLYPWGDEAPICEEGMYNGTNFAGNEDCHYKDSAKVKSFSPNGYGVYDMAGNVWEWVADWYSGTYYQESPYSNPPGADTGEFRTVRGGSWDYGSSYLRSAFRGQDRPTITAPDVGFRCVLDVSP